MLLRAAKRSSWNLVNYVTGSFLMKEERDYNLRPASLCADYRYSLTKSISSTIRSHDLNEAKKRREVPAWRVIVLGRGSRLVKKERGAGCVAHRTKKSKKPLRSFKGVAKRSRLFEEIVSTDDLK